MSEEKKNFIANKIAEFKVFHSAESSAVVARDDESEAESGTASESASETASEVESDNIAEDAPKYTFKVIHLTL